MKSIEARWWWRWLVAGVLTLGLGVRASRLDAQWSGAGDLNLSGGRDVLDVVILAGYIVGNVQQGAVPFTGPLAAAELNGDGAVDVFDVVLLQAFLVGNVPELPVGGITVFLPGGVPLVMVKIPAGTFQMGAPETERGTTLGEQPVHQVTLTQAYYLGKYEVTQGQWQAVMGTPAALTCDLGTTYGVGAGYPVYCVSWNDIATGSGSFVAKLNQHLTTTGQPGAGKFRLPTEAEWERAARGSTQTRFSFGDNLSCGDICEECALADQYMWWCGNALGTSHPVGQKLANAFGLYDMHGNELEWVQDWYGAYPSTSQTDPTGPTDGSVRVSRGGTWYFDLRYTRSAIRNSDDPDVRGNGVGVRLARSQ